MNQEKISSYIVGFLVIFALLFGLFAYIAISYGNQQYVKDTERVTKLVEALENNTTNIKQKGTIYQFTPPTTYCIYENIKKDDFRFGSRLFNFNSCSLLKSCAFYIIVGNFQGQFFHLKTTV